MHSNASIPVTLLMANDVCFHLSWPQMWTDTGWDLCITSVHSNPSELSTNQAREARPENASGTASILPGKITHTAGYSGPRTSSIQHITTCKHARIQRVPQVLSNANGVLVAALSVLLFHDAMPWRNCAGYAIVVAGAVSYVVSKARPPAPRAQPQPSLFHQAEPSTVWEPPSAANRPFGDALAHLSDGAACPAAGGLGANSRPLLHSRRGCSCQDWTCRSSCSAMFDEVNGDCVNFGGWGEGSPGGAGRLEASVSANDVDAPLLPCEPYGNCSLVTSAKVC